VNGGRLYDRGPLTGLKPYGIDPRAANPPPDAGRRESEGRHAPRAADPPASDEGGWPACTRASARDALAQHVVVDEGGGGRPVSLAATAVYNVRRCRTALLTRETQEYHTRKLEEEQ
jgi:hypothetical protein